MFGLSKTKTSSKDNIFLDYFKGLLLSILTSFALIILFALCLKWFDISDGFIVPMTLAIKGISVFVGACFAIRSSSSHGLVKGLVFGMVYMIFAFMVFGVLSGTFEFGMSSFLDLIFVSILGGLVGIVKVNRN